MDQKLIGFFIAPYCAKTKTRNIMIDGDYCSYTCFNRISCHLWTKGNYCDTCNDCCMCPC